MVLMVALSALMDFGLVLFLPCSLHTFMTSSIVLMHTLVWLIFGVDKVDLPSQRRVIAWGLSPHRPLSLHTERDIWHLSKHSSGLRMQQPLHRACRKLTGRMKVTSSFFDCWLDASVATSSSSVGTRGRGMCFMLLWISCVSVCDMFTAKCGCFVQVLLKANQKEIPYTKKAVECHCWLDWLNLK